MLEWSIKYFIGTKEIKEEEIPRTEHDEAVAEKRTWFLIHLDRIHLERQTAYA